MKYHGAFLPLGSLSGYTVKNLNQNPYPYSSKFYFPSVVLSINGLSYVDLCSNIARSAVGGAFFSGGLRIEFKAACYLKTSCGCS